jgi:vancomycin resistance protein YoaR
MRLIALLPRVALAFVISMLIAAVGVLVFRVLYDDRIYPAVVVGDVPVGGLTLHQADDRLVQRTAEIEGGLVAFTYAGETWAPTLAELGATVNLADSLAEAQALGRTGDAASRLVFTGAILTADQEVPLRINLDHRRLSAWFDQVERDIGQYAADAQMVIDGAHVSITPESIGIVINREAATTHLLGTFATLLPVVVELPVEQVTPEIARGDLLQAQEAVTQILGEPVSVSFESQVWSIDGSAVSPYLTAETVKENGVPITRLQFDLDGLAATLRAQYGEQVDREPVNAPLGWDDGVVALGSATDGVALEATSFARAVASSFLNGHDPVTVPVVTLEPKVDGKHLDALGIDTLLGQGDSNFSGGVEGRDENVRIATEFTNGTLVEPGGIFSFNQAIGEISYERGFQEALVVQGEGVGRDVGGGVCQVSTTVFRAALNAGMPIVEWYPHTFRLPHYELDDWGPGFDASILQAGPDPDTWADFRFENYSESWLLIEATVSYPYVFVNIYGSSDGRSVYIDTAPLGGNAFAFTRVLQDAKGNVLAERTFASYYLE